MAFRNRKIKPFSAESSLALPQKLKLVRSEVHQPEEQSQTAAVKHPIRTTLISMMIAVLVYGLFFGVPFAVGFVLLIWVHEMGHVLVLKRLGYQASAPVFIPFVGAIIGMKDQPKNAQTEALVGYGGPFVGTVGAYLVYLYYHLTDNSFSLLLAFTGFLINLFNLIPVSPLDGGRIATAISRWLWIPGLLFLLLIFFQVWNPIILIVVLIGIHRAYKSLFRPKALEEEGYFTVEPSVRFLISAAYFGLILFLGYFTVVSYRQLEQLNVW